MGEPWTPAVLQTLSPRNDSDNDSGGDDLVTEEFGNSSATQPPAGSPGLDPSVWGVWWPVHSYGFGSLFVLLCLYALYATVLRLCCNRTVAGGGRPRRSVQPVFTAINALVVLLGLSNAFMLLVDPYGLEGRVPLLLSAILLNTPYPCMTSAFALVNWVLVSISRMRMTRASKLRSAWFLAVVILSHFLLVLAACLVLVLVSPVLVLGIMCHGFFVVFGAFLCLTYVYSAWKIIGTERHTHKTLYDISTRDSGGSTTKSQRSLTSRLSSRLASGFGGGRSPKRAPSECMDSSTTKIFTIGEEESVQQTTVPPPPSTLQYEGATIGQKGTDATIRDTKDEGRLLPKENGNHPMTQYSNGGIKDVEGGTTGSEPQNGAPANGNATNGHGRAPAKADQAKAPNRSTSGKALGNGRSGKPAQQSSKYRATVDRQSGGKISGTGRPMKSTQKVFRIAAITAAIGLAASGLGLYGILGLMVAEEENRPTEWGWFAFQTCSRLLELCMGCTMAYFTTQPFPRRRQR